VPPTTCTYSVIQYVDDPERGEARNIGLVLLAPSADFGRIRLDMARTGLRPGGPRQENLRLILHSYNESLVRQGHLFEEVRTPWTQTDLERLHLESTNLIRFTKPGVIEGNPQKTLDALFERRVAGKPRKRRVSLTAHRLAQSLNRVLKPSHRSEWVREGLDISTGAGTLRFDLGLANGQVYCAIETLSFLAQDVQRTEQAGAWFAHAWPYAERATGAKGYLVVEPALRDTESFESMERVTRWAEEAKIHVAQSGELDRVAERIAEVLPS
jgi:hypothetical protein